MVLNIFKGWIHNFRKQKKFLFIDLKDGSSNEHLQVMIDQKTQPQNHSVGYGDAITVSGKIGTAPRGHLELRAETFELKGIVSHSQINGMHERESL